jgi:hypothetical protein
VKRKIQISGLDLVPLEKKSLWKSRDTSLPARNNKNVKGIHCLQIFISDPPNVTVPPSVAHAHCSVF